MYKVVVDGHIEVCSDLEETLNLYYTYEKWFHRGMCGEPRIFYARTGIETSPEELYN